MKRPELVKKLMNEGLSEKLLSNLTDKQLKDLSERVLSEATYEVSADKVDSIKGKVGDKDVIKVSEEDELEVPEEETQEGEVDEAARTKSNVHGDKGGANRAGIKSKTKYKAGSDINEEVKTLRKQNGEYKKALVLFKDKLNEVAVFNANLAYSTRLFTEHSTTRNEKLNILKRFDSVGTLTESKSTYKTIKGELESSKNVTESVVNKITSNNPTTSSSQDVLSESKAYESPQFSRMKELMSKIK